MMGELYENTNTPKPWVSGPNLLAVTIFCLFTVNTRFINSSATNLLSPAFLPAAFEL
jgi:hypothetical protein